MLPAFKCEELRSGSTLGRSMAAEIVELRFGRRIIALSFFLYALCALGLFTVLYSIYLKDESIGLIIRGVWRSAVVGGALCLFYIFLRYWTTKLVVTEHGITKLRGIFSKQYDHVAIDKVTNTTARRSLLALFTGLVDMRIDTAGTDAPEIQMKLLTLQDARRLRDKISELRRHDSQASEVW